MNRLALIAATGLMALVLTACGEHGNSKPPVPAPQDQNQAAPAQAPAPAQQPAEGQNH